MKKGTHASQSGFWTIFALSSLDVPLGMRGSRLPENHLKLHFEKSVNAATSTVCTLVHRRYLLTLYQGGSMYIGTSSNLLQRRIKPLMRVYCNVSRKMTLQCLRRIIAPLQVAVIFEKERALLFAEMPKKDGLGCTGENGKEWRLCPGRYGFLCKNGRQERKYVAGHSPVYS